MINSSAQLKDLIKNYAKANNIDHQILLRTFMMERFLERIAASPYKDKFILKGGMLISSIIGLGLRSTQDVDATVKGLPVDKQDMEAIIKEITAIDLGDNVTFQIEHVTSIMEDKQYPGTRFLMRAFLGKTQNVLKVDISTGDVITPSEIQYSYKLLLEDRSIGIMAYPLETVLAEKLETIISRNVNTTRMRDFYDVVMLYQLHKSDINVEVLKQALRATSEVRNESNLLDEADLAFDMMEHDLKMDENWITYQKKHPYMPVLDWDVVLNQTRKLYELIDK